MEKKMIYNIKNNKKSCCFFRSTVQKPNMKALLQITERCNLKCMVGGSVSRIIMVPLDPSETLTDSKAQLTIESFGDIQGNLEIEGVTNVECGDPTSSTGKGRVTMKYLDGRFKIYNFEN